MLMQNTYFDTTDVYNYPIKKTMKLYMFEST